MPIIKKIIARIDALQRKHGVLGFPLAVIKKYGDDESGKQAALLAYFGFLAIFPLLLVLATLLKLFLRGDGDLQRKILDGATNYIPVIGSQLGQNVHSLHGAGLALAIGILLTLYGARGIADVFRGAVNHIWEVPYVKRTSFPGSLIKSLLIVIIGGFGLIAAPIVAGYALNIGHVWVYRALALLITTVILFLLFILLARLAMSQTRPVRDVWVGALFAAVGIVILQSIGTYLITHQLKHLQDLYSTFAIVLGLMFWLYLQTQLVMYAIEIDSVRVLKLWPRALDQEKRTTADKAAYKLYAHRNVWNDQDRIEVLQEKETKKRPLLERLRDLGHEDSSDK